LSQLAVPDAVDIDTSAEDAMSSPFSPAFMASAMPGAVGDSAVDDGAVALSVPSVKRTSLASVRSVAAFPVGGGGTAATSATQRSGPDAVHVVVATAVIPVAGAGSHSGGLQDWTVADVTTAAAARRPSVHAVADTDGDVGTLHSSLEASNTAPGAPGSVPTSRESTVQEQHAASWLVPLPAALPAPAPAPIPAPSGALADSDGWEPVFALTSRHTTGTGTRGHAVEGTGGGAGSSVARRGGLPRRHVPFVPLPAWGQPIAPPAAVLPSGGTVLTSRFADLVAAASLGPGNGGSAILTPRAVPLPQPSPTAVLAPPVRIADSAFGTVDPSMLAVTPEVLLDNARPLTHDPLMEFLIGKAYRPSHLLFVVAELAVLLMVGVLLISWGEPRSELVAALQAAFICTVFACLMAAVVLVRPHKAEERYQAVIDIYVLLLAILQTCINCLNTVVRVRYGLLAGSRSAGGSGGDAAFTSDNLPDDPLVRGFKAAAYLVVAGAGGLFLLIGCLFVFVLWRGAELDAEAQRRIRFRQLTALARQAARKSVRGSLGLAVPRRPAARKSTAAVDQVPAAAAASAAHT